MRQAGGDAVAASIYKVLSCRTKKGGDVAHSDALSRVRACLKCDRMVRSY